MEQMENYLEQKKVNLDISFSVDTEIDRVEDTIRRYGWFKENGYSLKFPQGLNPDNPNTKTADVTSCVKEEFDVSVYEQKAEEIHKLWHEWGKTFFEKVKSFNFLIQPEYRLFLTRYGVGGSYSPPNEIILNFNRNYPQIENIMKTIFHEIIHLAIEGWIQEYHIDHWTKERLVDLTYNSIFEKPSRLQRDPENTEKVGQIFNTYFPDMKRVIVEISKIEQ